MGVRSQAGVLWRRAVITFRTLLRRWVKILTAVIGVVIVVFPVVVLGAFEPTKTCHSGIFCNQVWHTAEGFNYGLVVFLVLAAALIVLLVIAEISAPQHKPVTAWTKYAHDVAVWVAEVLGSSKIDQMNASSYREAATKLLATMAAVAGSLSSEETSVKVDASLMVAMYPPPVDVKGQVYFLHHGRSLSSYSGALFVDAYSSDNVALPHIVLPVDKGAHVLPGAPAACEKRGPVVIDDTLKIDWENHGGIDPELRAAVEKYFEDSRDVFRTLLCIPVKVRDTVLGVINTHSPTPRLFEGSAELVSEVLAPYVALVLALLDHRHRKNYPFVQGSP